MSRYRIRSFCIFSSVIFAFIPLTLILLKFHVLIENEHNHSISFHEKTINNFRKKIPVQLKPNIFEEANVVNDSCSRFMGNPYSQRTEVCDYITCWTSHKELVSSNCCLRNVTLQTDKLNVAKGGVDIEKVLGQSETDEFPTYRPNAWIFGATNNSCGFEKFQNVALPHYLQTLALAIGTHRDGVCAHTITEPTFAITRYDYANLFHTLCDWYNFYQAIQIAHHRNTNINVLLLDGHPAGALDDSWQTAFGKTTRISDLQQYPSVCFRELYLVSPGYRSPFFPSDLPLKYRCSTSDHVHDFADSFLSKHAVYPVEDKNTLRIGYIFRKDYLAHPRQGNIPRVSRKISNEEQLITAIQDFLSNFKTKALLVPLYLESMTLTQQLESISSLQVLVGVHGAGLSHVIFMKPGSTLIEIAPHSHAGLAFFQNIAITAGVKYLCQTKGIYDQGGGEYFHIEPTTHLSMLQEALKQYQD